MNGEERNLNIDRIREETAQRLLHLFVNRTDTYAIQREDGSYRRVDASLTLDILKRHLAGEVTVGAYSTSPADNTVKWICFDVDPEQVKEPEATTRALVKACEGRFPRKAVLLEASRHPDLSYHLWVLFEPPMPAKAARFLARKVMEHANVVVELFPKQDVVEPGEFGNLVKLPLGLHQAAKKRSVLLDPSTFKPSASPLLFDAAGTSLPEKDIQQAIAQADRERGFQTRLGGDGEGDRRKPPEKPYRGEDPACMESLLKGVEEGYRDNAAIRLACYLLNTRQLKLETVRKRLLEWNKQNRPPLEDRVIEEKVKSAEEGGYIYGCNDELLKDRCKDRLLCPLGKELFTDLDRIEFELGREKVLQPHPVIDYHPEIGLTYGMFLEASSRNLYISKEKAFTVDSEALKIRGPFAISHPAGEGSISAFHRIYKEQMLLRSRELLKGAKIENTPPNEVFKKTLQETCKYWFHSDPRYYIFIVCWIIGSYMYVVFGRYPPLHLQGPRRSGKSTLIDYLSHVAWNPTDPTHALRSAPLFRTIEASRPTFLVDVTRMDPESEEYGDVVDVFEAGGEEGHAVLRCIGEDKTPIPFNTFCPKAVASRQDLPFQDKCIRIITEQAKGKEYTQRRRFMRWDPELPPLVADLIRCALNLWPEVLKAYQALEQTEKLVGRPFDLWSPILAVCRVFAPDHYGELLSLAEEDAEKRERGDLMSEVEDAVLAILLPMKGETASLLLKELTEKVQNRVPWVTRWHPVQSAVTNLGIVKKKYPTSEGVAYQFDLSRVREKAQVRKIVLEEPPAGEAEGPARERGYTDHPCDECGGKPARLHIIPGKGERWLCDKCESETEEAL